MEEPKTEDVREKLDELSLLFVKIQNKIVNYNKNSKMEENQA